MNETYVFLRPVEAALIDDLIETLKRDFGEVRFLEIGVFGGNSTRGVVKKCREIGVPIYAAGVDFPEQKPAPIPTPDYEFHAGDSMDMWRNIHGSFNFLFIDACHCVNHSSQDFLNYSPFVEVGGYILLHDTALPTGKKEQGDWPQYHGYAGKKDSTLGVREALKKLGLLDGRRSDFEFVRELESDSGLMGMMLFRRVLPY